MKRVSYWLLVMALAFSLVSMPGCSKKKSDVRISEVWGKGSWIGPGSGGDSKLEFRVKAENQGDGNATIKEFLLEIKAGSEVVITATKTGSAAFQNQITPNPAGTYSVAADSVFTFSLLYYDHTKDIYNGKNPGTITVTLTIEDENGTIYTIDASAAFEWLRY